MSFYLLDNAQPNTQQWGYPRRGSSLSGTCIIHTAECAMDFDGADSSAENCAAFITGRSDYGSYHTLVDSDSIIEMVPYEYEAWQDSETNPWAVGISAAVQADNWDTIPAVRRDAIYRNLATAAADFVTYMKSKGITVPIRRITGQEARNGVPGFCAHGDSGIDRHDPGAQFDWALFFKYTSQALSGAVSNKEDELSAADVQAIKDHINAVMIGGYTWTDGKHYGGNAIGEHTQAVVDGIPQRVWATTVSRGGGKVSALQELADCKTALLGLQGQFAGLLSAIEQLAKAPGSAVDLSAVTAAAEAGAQKALSGLAATVTITQGEAQ
jgi:hypothetical protein